MDLKALNSWYLKTFKFEFWPWKMVYYPLLPYYFYLAFKNRSFAFPAFINTSLPLGGFFNENKALMLEHIPAEYLPKLAYVFKISKNENIENIKEWNIFPAVAKPISAQRGTNVAIIANEAELKDYYQTAKDDFTIQEFIDYEIELAILYSRLPGESKGIVSSVTQKSFLHVIGDGVKNLLELLEQNPRALLIIEDIIQNTKLDLKNIPAVNEKVIIEPIGNHCRGTIFLDAGNIVDKIKTAEICDTILKGFKGFHYGRFDLKIKSFNDMYMGKHIRILELNGVNADAAHIFDPNFKLLNAFKVIIWHWKRMSDIALINGKPDYSRASWERMRKVLNF